jgi:DNA-binding transcriptional LysR family regulator
MRDFSNAHAQLLSNGDAVGGHVSIGLIASITEGVLAETLSAFSTEYPDVTVAVADGYTNTLIDRVAGGQLDTAIVNRPRRPLALDVEHIVDEAMVLVTSAAHTGAVPARLTLHELAALGLPLVLPTRGHGLRSNIDSFAQNESVELAPKFEIDSIVTTLKLVEHTQLATIVPHIAVHRQLSAGNLRSHAIVSPSLIRQVVSVAHPRRPLNAATRLFIAMLSRNMLLRQQQHEPDPAGAA